MTPFRIAFFESYLSTLGSELGSNPEWGTLFDKYCLYNVSICHFSYDVVLSELSQEII